MIEAESRARVDAEEVRYVLMGEAFKERQIEIEAKGYEVRKVERQMEEVQKVKSFERCLDIFMNRHKGKCLKAFLTWKDAMIGQ